MIDILEKKPKIDKYHDKEFPDSKTGYIDAIKYFYDLTLKLRDRRLLMDY
jgi:hypothetical protein